MISISGRVSAQSNTTPWPPDPPVGIGTQTSPGGPQNALQIHYNSSDIHAMKPILRLSQGDSTTSGVFGILGLMPAPYDITYSSLSKGQDLILHEHSQGDLILTNFNPGTLAHPSGAIRIATTPDAGHLPFPAIGYRDLERVTILPNGNVGINLPPDTTLTGLGNPREQLQLGGGSIPAPGYLDPIPGLFFYGGNRFEGMTVDSQILPANIDWRFIDFNHYHDPFTGTGHRKARMASSGIGFSPLYDGMLQLAAWPYDTAHDDNVNRGVVLRITGEDGLSLYSDESPTDHFHHLFDVWRPGRTYGAITRNVHGLCFHHTPVLIDTGGPTADFTNFANVNPDMGDNKTWMLVVDGPELAKEVFVLDTVWADFVFDSTYALPTLGTVEQFIKANKHLPGVPSAKEVAKTGLSLGATDAKLMQKVEELTLYVIELNKKLDAQQEVIQELKNQKGK